jgi:hypothetical protein
MGLFYLIIGCYVTALLAGYWELEHALGLATLSIVMCIVSMVKYPLISHSGIRSPSWSSPSQDR